jgi:hypothetical protein
MNDLKQENLGLSYESPVKKNIYEGRRLSIAPMMDWTDKSVSMRVSGRLSVISP